MARPRVRSVTALLVVTDLQRSVDFYCEKLGFVEPSIHGDPPCFAILNRDGFDLMLGLAEFPTQVRPNGPDGTFDLYIGLSDVAAEAEALVAAGVPIVKGPTDTFYGMREVECLDPDGHRLCLAQDIGSEPFRVAEAWTGGLDVGGKVLNLVLKLAPSGGGLVGRLDSPDQGARDLPIDRVALDGRSFRFEMSALGATYLGQLGEGGDVVEGMWSQGGRSWPLAFRRS